MEAFFNETGGYSEQVLIYFDLHIYGLGKQKQLLNETGVYGLLYYDQTWIK